MRVGGADVLSERTEKSSRFVLIAAAVVILVKEYKVPIDDLSFLGVKIPSDLFDTAALVMIAYASITYLQHWIFDVYAWHSWYEDNTVDTWDGTVSIGKYIENKVDTLFESKSMWDSNKELFDDLITKLSSHNSRAQSISVLGWLYVAGQHFLLPMSAVAWATYAILSA
jgi:hypothetical protein